MDPDVLTQTYVKQNFDHTWLEPNFLCLQFYCKIFILKMKLCYIVFNNESTFGHNLSLFACWVPTRAVKGVFTHTHTYKKTHTNRHTQNSWSYDVLLTIVQGPKSPEDGDYFFCCYSPKIRPRTPEWDFWMLTTINTRLDRLSLYRLRKDPLVNLLHNVIINN